MSLERLWDRRNRTPVLLFGAALMLIIAVVGWRTKPYLSLGFLYLFPMILASAFLPRPVIALVGVACAWLAEVLSSRDLSFVRLGFEALALAGSGLFVAELVRNRRQHWQAEQRLRGLVDTSPAAIVTVAENGAIELANRAAVELMAPRDHHLVGSPIAAFFPELHHALRSKTTAQLHAPMQCQGHRDSGESFTAELWISTYEEGSATRLAAIIADVTENNHSPAASSPGVEQPVAVPLNNRETAVLRLVLQGKQNRQIAARMQISESAVKNTMQGLFGKTGVRTRTQLVRVALERYRSIL